ncbi:ATP-binding cassette protein subfamily A member 6 putative (ABCA6) [Leptomonas seymouri]|uniref:ATP-binding cassette protein subfamily A member 6 putative (ABCA6) n=1 Tax=Leptomonas seymouri TaxID=5684 RepID=A0A0N0P411_LEPSE|nr:ATP-binding cassette protein subfamily A member 6 putative (ABCA6) [Leptomonas seymouri]|eukprot:KPI84759.1 ATP-binding cassette protein subfamily A member 6 putative (ABCA6) [Leptomonas seymouri]
MGRRRAARHAQTADKNRPLYHRNVQITDNTRMHSVGSSYGGMLHGATTNPLERKPKARTAPELGFHASIEPNVKGGSFSDQFLATMERTIQQKLRDRFSTSLEMFVPLLFVLGSVILWAAFGDRKHPLAEKLDYHIASSVIIPNFYTYISCNNQSMGIFPGLKNCETVAWKYDCSGDESSLPLKGLCFDASLGADGFVIAYLNAILGNAAAIPQLDTIIIFQWAVRKGKAVLASNAATSVLAAAGITPSTRMNAIADSGRLYFAPESSVPPELVDWMNKTSLYFHYVYGGTFKTLKEAENYVKHSPDQHWGIVEVKAMNATDFDVVLHMRSTALPSMTKVTDIQYPGGFRFDRGELYLASGFNSIQKALCEYYLFSLGYTEASRLHLYMASFGSQAFTEKMLLSTAAPLVAFILVLSFLYPVTQLTKKIVLEKELRIRESMMIMGLRNSSLYLSWFVTYALQYFIECIFIVVFLKMTFVPSSDAFILFFTFYLFTISTIPLSGLIATFFSKARIASMLAPLIYFALSVPTFAFSSAADSTIVGVSVLSPTAFAAALTNILTMEVGTGFVSADLRNPMLSPQSFTLYIMLSVDFVIYFFLMLYCDAVLPKDWGTTKHPLFFVTEPLRWYRGTGGATAGENEDGRAEDGVFEDDGDDDAAVKTVGLRKAYRRNGKSFIAVNNLYWSMKEREISVLLGHNGAGKTTTMNMITGMTEPDEGDCYIYGHSVREELAHVRQQIGFCPQHNILWSELTCREHLEFYGKIKGLHGGGLEDAVQMILHEVALLDKIEYPSRALSGGQKRKLSVAIAFVGRSRLIFLDEPTAGMDVGARRYTWELLRRMSEMYTIMLTTHYMDEADLLGHKIGIMSQGRLQCSGSSMFLKSRLGVGYNMIVTVDPEADAENVDRLVTDHVPSAEAATFNGVEIVYKLPMEDVELFPSLLAGLEADGDAAGVRGYSLSATTLEEVFLQIAMDDALKHGDSSSAEENEDVVMEENHAVWHCEMLTSTTSCMASQFKAMMAKRLWNSLRDRRMQCFQLVCPVACILLAMLLSLVSLSSSGSIELSSEMFNEKVQMEVSGCDGFIGTMHSTTRQNVIISDRNFMNAVQMSQYATDTSKVLKMPRYTSIFCSDTGLSGAVPNEDTATILFYNTSAYHSGGLVVQQFYSYILQNHTGDLNRVFKIATKPMPESISTEGITGGVQTILIGAIVMIPFTFLPSNPVAWIVKERECKARYLQNVSGLSFYIYWLTNFLFDIATYVITLMLILIIFFIFGRKEYIGSTTAGPTIVMFMVYGLCSTVCAYALSFAFQEHSAAQSIVMAASFVTGFLLVMMVYILSLIDYTKSASDYLRWPFRIVPSYCVGESIINLAMNRQREALGEVPNPWDMGVIGWPCVYMAIEFPLFVVLTLFIDHPRRRMWGQKRGYNRGAPAEVIEDEDSDVEDERQEVYEQERRNVNEDIVRVVDLRKVYSNGKAAVRNITFSILPDEVFGFLGTNGAGKTTTISILCQEFIPTSGSAYVCGYDIVENSAEALQCIGYCPQFDATLDLLTVEEHLCVYAGIRGILYEQRPKVVSGLMRLCDITEYRNTTSAQLSGGNRRKLSVALALMGSPQIVFLDEPSAGMDPVARRGLWTAIQRISQNCSVVLTTHHLEEVEALADSVAIMADGALRCVGEKLHLKNKYGSGFELSLRIADTRMKQRVQDFVQKNFVNAVMNESKGQRFVFALPQDTKLSEAFACIQENQAILGITDYSVSQTSIEQVFLRIIEQQEERMEDGAVAAVPRFTASHATLHNYQGNSTALRRHRSDSEGCGGWKTKDTKRKAVAISVAALHAYRQRQSNRGMSGSGQRQHSTTADSPNSFRTSSFSSRKCSSSGDEVEMMERPSSGFQRTLSSAPVRQAGVHDSLATAALDGIIGNSINAGMRRRSAHLVEPANNDYSRMWDGEVYSDAYGTSMAGSGYGYEQIYHTGVAYANSNHNIYDASVPSPHYQYPYYTANGGGEGT